MIIKLLINLFESFNFRRKVAELQNYFQSKLTETFFSLIGKWHIKELILPKIKTKIDFLFQKTFQPCLKTVLFAAFCMISF